jgi:cell wall-associated NlpC family hydrolase
MQRLYGMAGVVIPRDAYLQSTSPLGRAVDPQTPPAAGDLVFFLGPTDRRGRGITHVGMALDPVRFVHGFSRAGVVETDFLDEDYMAEYTNKGAWRINQEAE